LPKKYDVVIVGAGPAGIFTALELTKIKGLKVLILEKGEDIDKRFCPARKEGCPCQRCSPCSLLSGWGGAGAFSDGKLNLSPQIGGQLNNYLKEEELKELINYVDGIYLKFGAPKRVYGDNEDEIDEIRRRATLAELQLQSSKIRHTGTEKCFQILKKMREHLKDKIEIHSQVEVKKILLEKGKVSGVETKEGKKIYTNYLVVAPGREGANWLTQEAHRLHLKTFGNPVDVGVRVEVPAEVLEFFTQIAYELKLVFFSSSFDDKVRTFCMCPYGEIVTEYNNGITTVNGHSYRGKKTPNTNFALLVSTSFTDPFHEPIAYGQYLARLANLLGGGVIIQRLGDLIDGRRTNWERIERGIVKPTLKEAPPGDLSFALPYRYLSDILEMLKAMDVIAPGINSRHTLLYGIEVKFYSSRLELSSSLETKVKGLFASGDGAGITRGLVQASASGVAVGREIAKRVK